MFEKFENKVQYLMSEDYLIEAGGGLLGKLGTAVVNTASTAGAFYKAAQDPKYFFDLLQNFIKNKKERGEKPIGKDNKPSEGDYVQYAGDPNIKGKIIAVYGGGETFMVQLVSFNPIDQNDIKKLSSNNKTNREILKKYEKTSEYQAVRTKNNGSWHFETLEKINQLKSGPDTGVDPDTGKSYSRDKILVLPDKSGKNVYQLTTKVLGGQKTNFKEWYFYTGEYQQFADDIGEEPTPPPPGDVKEARRPPKNGDTYVTTPKDTSEAPNTWVYNGKVWVNQATKNPASNLRVNQLITTWWSIKNFGPV